MNFLRLRDDLLSILFEDADIIAIDKPYGFNAHTNDSKIEHSDFIQDGLIEIFEKHLGKKLHIIHRLDQTTTGVMIFGKSTESAKKYAEFFFQRQVKKTYWFITNLKSTKSSFYVDKVIIHKGKELDANTDLNLIRTTGDFALWQANPHTGRNHQIRIHAEAAGISILGDPKYGGSPYPFLCLHNHKIEFPNGIVILSRPPTYFENLSLLQDTVLSKALFEADRRLRLFSLVADVDQCFRLVHSKSTPKEGGYTLDQMGKVLILNWFKENWGPSELKKFSYLSTALSIPIVVQSKAGMEKAVPDKNQLHILPSPSSKPIGPTWIAKEGPIQYEIRTNAGLSVGLTLNQRLQRNWLLKNSVNKSVLNLFSYNCEFSLAAALGQATQVTSVEANKKALNWGRRNFEINGLDQQKFTFLCRDSLTYLEQCRTKKTSYDMIVCDAPSFLRREKGIFKIESGLDSLLQTCLGCLAPHGELLFSTTCDSLFIDDLRKAIKKAQKELNIQDLEINCLLPSLDFELPDERATLKSFWIRKGA